MTYFTDGKHVFCSHKPDMPFDFCYSLPKEGEILFLFRRLPLTGRETFAVNDTGVMTAIQDEALLSTLERPELDVPPDLAKAVKEGRVRGINLCHPRFEELLDLPPRTEKYRVKLLTPDGEDSPLLQELQSTGGDLLSSIDICHGEETGFDCDVFLFCSSDPNLVATCAKTARQQQFKGKFWVVSDAASVLCKTALMESNRNEKGKLDHMGLFPEQVRGFSHDAASSREILSALRGEWHTSAIFLGGAFLCCENRDAENGPDLRRLPLFPEEMARIRETADKLRSTEI